MPLSLRRTVILGLLLKGSFTTNTFLCENINDILIQAKGQIELFLQLRQNIK